jgi:KipI family sensor histidine kinase inhibitor
VTPRISAFGDSALMVELGDEFDESVAAWARTLAQLWSLGPAVPAYTSVVVSFDPDHVDADIAERKLRDLLDRGPTYAYAADPSEPHAVRPRLVEIRTRYDGPDLDDVAARSGMSRDELIRVHSEREYSAIFLGFLPGWAYCARLDPRIIATRLPSPRPRVPAGSVGVVDGQTGVYPYPSPGGWRLIGTTDAVMFDPNRQPASLIRAGDRVRFVPR